ncbi:hypothetical protein RND81_13G138200 [Saponaria officinalis]|uniref:Fumarylacetoacetase-like C-terminal domain-containing protein n=1 Tax=Saponaria officinalis TaxID=3572 RepID=A0AAW1H5I0_SAPOF
MDELIASGTKIVGVGRNYHDATSREQPESLPKEPVLFLKPTSSYLANGGTIEVPSSMEHLWYEAELAVVIGKKARDVPESAALEYVAGYALGLDMTAKELQAIIKASGLPWMGAKAGDTFAPISKMVPKSAVPDPHDLELWLEVDGELRQKGSTKDMIFTIPFLISHISSFMTLMEGDVILTGTPEGIGPVKPGQKLTAGITGLVDVNFDVAKRSVPVHN